MADVGEAELLNELKQLRKGPGILGANLYPRTGSILRALAAIEPEDDQGLIRLKLTKILEKSAQSLPADLKTAAMAALNLRRETQSSLLQERVEWAAKALNRDERTIRRRMDEGLKRLAVVMMANARSLSQPSEYPAESDLGFPRGRGPRMFLSYADEDRLLALRLVAHLEERGVESFWWLDAEQRGRRFVGEIERGIAEADLFVVLMSPDYLASPWCRHERELGIQREMELGHQFVYVLKVAETRYTESGILGGYAWIDLTSQDAEALAAVDAALPLDRVQSGVESSAHPIGARPVFRNRQDELNAMINALTTTGGRDLWLVVSPPGMGKSWLLDRLQKELCERDTNYLVWLLDLREHPSDLREDPTRLLGALLNVEGLIDPDTTVDSVAVQRVIAAEISRRARPQLYMLDSADLLDAACSAQVRSALTGIYQMVRKTGTPHSRLSLAIGSRRHDDWKGLGNNPAVGLRFHTIALSEFGVDVAHQALYELGHNLGVDRLWDYAKRLHRLTEGLPALLIPSLRWAERMQFLEMEESDRITTFDTVARPYIRDKLLSLSSLMPQGGYDPALAKDLLERALQKLVPYRLLTQSHVRFHVEGEPDFKDALQKAGWSLDDLWLAVSRTALLKRPLEEPWQVIHPPIRRLLYRYYYSSDYARRQAHATARRFYRRWTAEHHAGKEQGVVLVECLWHEAARMMIEEPSRVRELLPHVAAELATELAKSPFYQPAEFSEFVANRISADEEFQLLFREHEGLFDDTLRSVVATIHGSV